MRVLEVWPDVKDLVDNKWYGKVSMGYVIKRLGLNGKRIGNAEVSDKHSNFIVNLGSASSSDVISIINEIKLRVTEVFGFAPEPEVEIVK
jgi:UDP-N-acetylmuramate dehydrogenase